MRACHRWCMKAACLSRVLKAEEEEEEHGDVFRHKPGFRVRGRCMISADGVMHGQRAQSACGWPAAAGRMAPG